MPTSREIRERVRTALISNSSSMMPIERVAGLRWQRKTSVVPMRGCDKPRAPALWFPDTPPHRAHLDDHAVALLLLLLALFAAAAVFMILIIAFTLLMALGTNYAAAGSILLFAIFSTVGGLALSAISSGIKVRRWSWPVATAWQALAIAAGLGIAAVNLSV